MPPKSILKPSSNITGALRMPACLAVPAPSPPPPTIDALDLERSLITIQLSTNCRNPKLIMRPRLVAVADVHRIAHYVDWRVWLRTTVAQVFSAKVKLIHLRRVHTYVSEIDCSLIIYFFNNLSINTGSTEPASAHFLFECAVERTMAWHSDCKRQ